MGEQISANFRHPAFSESSASEYRLSILMGVDSLCFELSDSTGSSLLWKDLTSDDFLSTLGREPLLTDTRYARVTLALCQTPAVIVPARLFDPNRTARYWESLSVLPEGHTVMADHLKTPDAWLVYPVSQNISRMLPQASIIHSASTWLQMITDDNHSAEAGAVYAHIYANMLLLAAWNTGELQFFNIFNFQSASDFLYYVLLAFQQSRLPAETTPLRLSGKISTQSEIYPLLQRYCNNIDFFAPAAAGPYPYGLPPEHNHWYLDLCGLKHR